MKKNILFGVIFSLLFSPFYFCQAVSASLAISSAKQEYTVGQVFQVSIFLNSGGENWDTARANLNFDPQFLEITGFSFGPQIKLSSGSNGYDNSSGIFSYGGGVPGGTDQNIVFGTISFRAKKVGSTQVSLGSNSLVLSAGNNRLAGNSAITYNFISPQTPKETPKTTSTGEMPTAQTKDEESYALATDTEEIVTGESSGDDEIKVIAEEVTSENDRGFSRIVPLILGVLAFIFILFLILKKRKKAALSAFIVFAMTGGVLPFLSSTEAAESQSIVVQPAKTEVTGRPGQNIKESFIVINRGNSTVKLTLSVKDFRITDENGKMEFFNKEQEPASDWIIPQFVEIGVTPLQTKKVEFIVSIPKDISPGGHYGAIILETKEENSSQTKKFGTLVLLTVLGKDAVSGGKISDFSISKAQDQDPIKINLSLQNSGNTHLTTQGNIIFTNWKGEKIGEYNPGELTVFPGTTRNFSWEWRDHSLSGFYTAEVKLTNSAKPDQKLESKNWFLVSPIDIWLSFLFALVIAACVFLVKKKTARKSLVELIQAKRPRFVPVGFLKNQEPLKAKNTGRR